MKTWPLSLFLPLTMKKRMMTKLQLGGKKGQSINVELVNHLVPFVLSICFPKVENGKSLAGGFG